MSLLEDVLDVTDFSRHFFSLKNKNAVVTGGNTGIGQTISLALTKSGANLFIPSLIDDQGATKKLVEKEDNNVQVESLQIDITDQGAPEKIIKECVHKYGSLDILVNCAGLCINTPVEKFNRQPWDKMVDVNLTAAFELIHEAAKEMVPQRRGKIINVCSLFSFLGGQWSPAYAATKHGLAGLTKAYCDELAQYNIQVNGIAPGYFATDLTTETRAIPEANARVLDHIPANHWGNLVDLMGPIVFLASDASNYVNGHVLVVDGGYLVR